MVDDKISLRSFQTKKSVIRHAVLKNSFVTNVQTARPGLAYLVAGFSGQEQFHKACSSGIVPKYVS
jgi:hypothetical protein